MEKIPFARAFIGKEEEDAVLAVLRSGWLTTGKETLEFEKEFGAFLGNIPGAVKPPAEKASGGECFCMAVNSATSGLHLALEACGVDKGDIVLVPSMTFTATAEVIRYLGAEAVFVDVAKGGFHMDPACLERTLERLSRGLPAYAPRKCGEKSAQGFGPRGRALAVIPVHYGGLPCDMDAILRIAKKYSLRVVEDAAHSFPSLTGNGYAGTIGDLGVYSFYSTKTITTGEGGMVVTRDRTAAERIKIMRSHGIDRSIWNRYTDSGVSWYYEVVAPGFKYNIPDILSALGRAQLRRAADLLSLREDIARRYDEAFSGDDRFLIPPTGPGDARHLYPIRLNTEKLSINRDEFAAKLQAEGIGISVHFIPLHTMPYYRERYSLEETDFPETLDSYKKVISLPIWPGMSGSQINRVIAVVKSLGSEYNR